MSNTSGQHIIGFYLFKTSRKDERMGSRRLLKLNKIATLLHYPKLEIKKREKNSWTDFGRGLENLRIGLKKI